MKNNINVNQLVINFKGTMYCKVPFSLVIFAVSLKK